MKYFVLQLQQYDCWEISKTLLRDFWAIADSAEPERLLKDCMKIVRNWMKIAWRVIALDNLVPNEHFPLFRQFPHVQLVFLADQKMYEFSKLRVSFRLFLQVE